MRKFRLKKDANGYDVLVPGCVYDENYTSGFSILGLVSAFPKDWEEVTETKTETVTEKPLHKDTDLGYFAGLMVANGYMVDDAIYRAKGLIEELDNETERH